MWRLFTIFQNPFLFEDFEKLLFRIIKSYRESENASFLLKEDGAEEVIFAENIIAIHSINAKKKRIQIFLEYKTIEAYGVLSEGKKTKFGFIFLSVPRILSESEPNSFH